MDKAFVGQGQGGTSMSFNSRSCLSTIGAVLASGTPALGGPFPNPLHRWGGLSPSAGFSMAPAEACSARATGGGAVPRPRIL